MIPNRSVFVVVTALLLLLSPTPPPYLVHAFLGRLIVGVSSSRNVYSQSCRTAMSLSKDSTDSEDNTVVIHEDQLVLADGVSMQVLSSFPSDDRKSNNKKPVLLFLHGSFHGAWCWAERFFPYFVNKASGYTVVAPSWRGTGGTPAAKGVKKVKIMEHVSDLDGLLAALPELVARYSKRQKESSSSQVDVIKPVVICHSFGGLAVMKYLELYHDRQPFSGVVTICSVPPSGNSKMTMRYLRRSLTATWKITAGFAMKRCLKDTSLCRVLFFGGDKIVNDADGTVIEDYGVSDDDVIRYQSYFRRDSEATIDLLDLAKQPPSATTTDDGVAASVHDDDDAFPPCLVMGASDDYLVDREGLEETARYFGLDRPVVIDSPHDVMLGRKWRNAAERLQQWLQEQGL